MMQKIVTIVHCLFAIGAACVCTGAESEPDAPVYLQIPGYDELEFSGCAAAAEKGHFWVCSDENKRVIWKINAATRAAEAYAWDAAKLDDMEGLASDARGGLFALCSQSLNSSGNMKKSRMRFAHFAGGEWRAGNQRTIKGFRETLLKAFPWLHAYRGGRPKQGGIDMEGVAYDHEHDMLFLGFRGPLVSADDPSKPGDQAVLLVFDRFHQEWKAGGGKMGQWRQKGNPTLLNLEGLGVRDLYHDGSFQLYILAGELSGNRADEHPSLRLWRYNLIQKELIFLQEIAQVPSREGGATTWSAPEGICAIQVKGKKKLVIVYDSIHSGIYRLIDFPWRAARPGAR